MNEEIENGVDSTLDTQDPEIVEDKEVIALREQNKQLYARAKKAEGFELKDGHWVKNQETSKEPEAKLDYGLLAFHNTKADSVKIESDEDKEFLRKTLAETGKSQESILSAKWFVQELLEKQKERATEAATPKGSKRSSYSQGDDLSIAMAKYNETGELPQDRTLREKVIDTRYERETTGSKFYNG